MIELAIAALLRPVRTPDRLDLETPERERNLILMLHHVPRERHGQIVAQPLLAHRHGKLVTVNAAVLIPVIVNVNALERITAVQDLEKQFVPLIAILSKKSRKILHGRSLYLDITIGPVNRTDCVENIIPCGHLFLAEVPCSLRYRRFLCHILKLQSCDSYIFVNNLQN